MASDLSGASLGSACAGRLSVDFQDNFRVFNEKRQRSRGASLLLSSGNLPSAKQARATAERAPDPWKELLESMPD
eukprot:2125773-Prymnesium_polylepis.1